MRNTKHTFDRRSLLTGSAAVLGGLWLASSRASASPHVFVKSGKDGAPGEDDAPRTLLVLELSGGNDGLDTIVPYGDDLYHKSRTRIGLETAQLSRIDEYRAFNPELKKVRELYGEGCLAIVEGTGYPHPNRSHFTSQDIWYTAHETGRASGDGWLGRLTAALYPEDRRVPHLVHIGTTKPYSVKSSTHPVVYFDAPPAYRFALNANAIVDTSRPTHTDVTHERGSPAAIDRIGTVVLSAQESSMALRKAALEYKPRVAYPDTELAKDLQTAAALLQGRVGARILSVTQTGYDTHDSQRGRHDALLRELDAALSAFFRDVRGTRAGDNLTVVMFSEFGRRVEDNASGGTDHGVAGPMFVLGTHVQGGLYGKHPSLSELDEGDLVHTTDFRLVYASVIARWMGVDSQRVLGASYPEIALFA
jgi:uncharacterized protein (DUF1501 family)